MNKNLLLVSQLKDDHFNSCMTVLTNEEILWKVSEINSKNISHRIGLHEVVGAVSFSQVHNEEWPRTVFKKLKKIKFKGTGFLPGFVVASVVRTRKSAWGVHFTYFFCDSDQQVDTWTQLIQTQVFISNPCRPHNLLVFINPFGGSRTSQYTYDTQVAPMFRLSGIQTKIVVTTHRNHMADYLIDSSLDSYDGIIAVGGDGFLAEAVQGLLLHERQKANLPLYIGHQPGDVELPVSLRLGVIPTGSTDAGAFSIHGTNDILTALLHIIVGDELGLDVVSIHDDEDGTFLRYSITMVGFGFHADLLKNDDKLRWMGPRRYDYSGFKTFLAHACYAGEISFLPCSNINSHPSDGILCSTGCDVCKFNNLNTIIPNKCYTHELLDSNGCKLVNTSIDNCNYCNDTTVATSSGLSSVHSSLSSIQSVQTNPNSNIQQESVNLDSQDSDIGPSLSFGNENNQTNSFKKLTATNQTDDYCNFEIRSSDDPATPIWRGSNSHIKSRLPSWVVNGSDNGWFTIRGHFLAVNGFIQSCRCAKSKWGPSPWAHLGDGCLDLVLVNKCTSVQFFRYLLRIARTELSVNRNPFALPYITVRRVCAFRFVAKDSDAVPYYFHQLAFSDLTKKRNSEQSAQNIDSSGQLNAIIPNFVTSPQTNDVKKTSNWCSDGELIKKTNVICFVHRQLIHFFGRGPELNCSDSLQNPIHKHFNSFNSIFENLEIGDQAVINHN